MIQSADLGVRGHGSQPSTRLDAAASNVIPIIASVGAALLRDGAELPEDDEEGAAEVRVACDKRIVNARKRRVACRERMLYSLALSLA